jgi:hypothetical protein
MDGKETILTCFSCGRSEVDVPLLRLQYSSKELHICPQCLPTLIHHFDRLVDKLAQG